MIVEKARAASSQARVPLPDMQYKAKVAKTEPSGDAGVASRGINSNTMAHLGFTASMQSMHMALVKATPAKTHKQ